MKRILLLALLLSTAIAGTALEQNDFSYVVKDNPLSLSDQEQTVITGIYLNARTETPAFNMTIRFLTSPTFQINNEVQIIDIVELDKGAHVTWKIKTTEPGEYDLSNSFEIVSWDDSVEIEVTDLPTNTNQKTVTIQGTTDSAAICEKHNYVGFWGEQENCQVKLTINGNDYWAERDGTFTIQHELQKGTNNIEITARDPGGNINQITHVLTYTPSFTDTLKENIIPVVIVLVIIIAGTIGGIVYWKGRKAAREDTLEELRATQEKLFIEYARRSAMSGGFDKTKVIELTENFKAIIKKDPYYTQEFTNPQQAIEEHENIFKNEKVSMGLKGFLREQYTKTLKQK